MRVGEILHEDDRADVQSVHAVDRKSVAGRRVNRHRLEPDRRGAIRNGLEPPDEFFSDGRMHDHVVPEERPAAVYVHMPPRVT